MFRVAIIIHEFSQHWKMILAGFFATVATIANVVLPSTADDWSKLEDISLKLALLMAVIILWRVWQADRERFRQEIVAQRDRHDEKMETIVRENTESNRAVVTTMHRQVQYFDELTKRVVDEHITQHGKRQ